MQDNRENKSDKTQTPLLKNISSFFDSHGRLWVDGYSSKEEAWHEYYPIRLRENYALSLVHNENKATALDLGCGTGHALIRMKKMGFERVIGVDISNNMLSSAKKLIADNDLSDSIELFNCDVRKLSMIESESVDVCIALGVIEYLEEDEPFLSEINRILKPDGVCVIQTRNSSCIRTKTLELAHKVVPFYKKKIWYRVHHPANFRSRVETCGFMLEVERYAHYYALHPLDLIPLIRVAIKPIENFLSKKFEALSGNPLSMYIASMYIVKLRKSGS